MNKECIYHRIYCTPELDSEHHSGEFSAKITNEPKGNSGWRGESIPINHSKTITFGGWSKAQDVSSDALYALDFRIDFDDGSYMWYYKDTKFTIGTHEWEHTEVTKTFDKPVTSIKAYVLLYRGTGTVWFDDIYVIDEEETPTELKVVENYTYDKNGNRATATVEGTTITASYTLDDQLEVYGDNTYRYDDDGYMIEKTTPNGKTTYEYGTLGELRKVVTPTQTIAYEHNANNQKVAKKVNNEIVEKYLWANLTILLAIYDKDNNLIQRFEYADSRMPISMMQNNQKYYLHYDQVGTLKAVSNSNQKIIKKITYDTYGNIRGETNKEFKVPFGFAGGLYDHDSKLTRFGYRDYDAYTGKWTAKDPIGFAGGDANLYGYVLQDPVGFFDANGLDPKLNGRGIPSAMGGDVQSISLYSFEYEIDWWNAFFTSIGDFTNNYQSMRTANTIGADKYFHCLANCQATNRGDGGWNSAKLISETRELTDQYLKGDSENACNEDREANKQGQKGGRCKQTCKKFRPSYLDLQW